MSLAIVTGSSGLIGSETVRFLHEKGMEVIGIDNNMRQYFFGEEGSTLWNKQCLLKECKKYIHFDIDIRNQPEIQKLFSKYERNISLVVHCAAQPSHDWAAKEPITDFTVNALGTLTLLESTRKYSPHAVFIFTSTNKVYGDTPNKLPLIEYDTRWEIKEDHPFSSHGIDETMSIDNSTHSIFGASKVAADLLVQEYGRYFKMNTCCFRCGCLTGPAHSGVELHGFLAYLVKCALIGRTYTIYGYRGKQVRDNIHSYDLVNAFWHFFENPKQGEVYNMGGSRHSNSSILEAISITEEFTNKKLQIKIENKPRIGDHIWWISDVRKFKNHHPNWKYKYDIRTIIKEIIIALKERI